MAYTTIDKPTDYFNTITWTGDATTKDITGVGFQPDWVWAKKRSATGYHALADSVRGGTKNIFSNTNDDEETSATDWILSFASDGFGVNSGGNLNQSSATYVAWNWLAGGTASSNTDGTITSSVSANTTAGFSIVTYSGNSTDGATVGHGLGATPGMIIVKGRDAVINWQVYHHKNTSAPETDYLELDTTDATADSAARWNDTAPTSSVFTLGSQTGVNAGFDYVAYCFAEKKGYSKFGSYTGNGSTDGTFVYTGFKPAWVMVKRTDSTSDWLVCDNKRPGFNPIDDKLFPNTNQAEDPYEAFDFVSNGFKITSSGTGHNASGANMIYMALAESPFVSSGGIPTTAR
tara:strand:- start:15 stop:1055 length:1041 start_codon:yes stop_codon:yes gene_type:complete